VHFIDNDDKRQKYNYLMIRFNECVDSLNSKKMRSESVKKMFFIMNHVKGIQVGAFRDPLIPFRL
jgi:hypothetical protein